MASRSKYHPEPILLASKQPNAHERLSAVDDSATWRLTHLAGSFPFREKAMWESRSWNAPLCRHRGRGWSSMRGTKSQTSSCARPYHPPRPTTRNRARYSSWRRRSNGVWLLDSPTHHRFDSPPHPQRTYQPPHYHLTSWADCERSRSTSILHTERIAQLARRQMHPDP